MVAKLQSISTAGGWVGGISRSRLCTLDRFYNHSFGHPIDRMGLSSGPSVAIFILSVHEHVFVYNISEAELEKVEYPGSQFCDYREYMEIIFHLKNLRVLRNCTLYIGHLSLSFKFE